MILLLGMVRNEVNMKLIVSDLDGTLLNNEHKISTATKNYLNNLGDNFYFVPCTARSLATLPACLDEILFRYVIACNGVIIYDQLEKKRIAYHPIDQHIIKSMVNDLREYNIGFTVIADNVVYYERARKTMGDYFLDGEFVDDISEVLEMSHPFEKLHMTFDCQEEKARAWKVLEGYSNISLTSSYFNNIEVTHPQATKGNALITLAKHLQIPIEDTISFGDNLNDASMLLAAGHGVQMKNAQEELNAYSDSVTMKSNNEDGLIDYLEYLNNLGLL